MKEIKLFEMFAGYGGASFALKKIGIEYEVVGYSEIDKYAIQCYNNNFPNIKNYGDCREIDPNKLPDFNLLTGGFPCQAFSIAGKNKGELDPRGTLFYDIIRIAEIKKPIFMLLENVKGLTFKKHKETFNKILSELDRIGYVVKWKILNSKDYGIPQNRERVWFVCFLKEIDTTKFKFPNKEELKIFIKDILEDEVDEKYFLNEKQIKRIMVKSRGFNEIIVKKKCSPILCQLNNPKHSNDRVYSNKGLSPTLNSMQGGNRQPFIKLIGNYSPSNYDSSRIVSKDGIAPAVKENHGTITATQLDNFKIRKLTPKECFRLMGFLNDEINIDGLSDTQKYKLAGNGWDINLVYKIFNEMFKITMPRNS